MCVGRSARASKDHHCIFGLQTSSHSPGPRCVTRQTARCQRRQSKRRTQARQQTRVKANTEAALERGKYPDTRRLSTPVRIEVLLQRVHVGSLKWRLPACWSSTPNPRSAQADFRLQLAGREAHEESQNLERISSFRLPRFLNLVPVVLSPLFAVGISDSTESVSSLRISRFNFQVPRRPLRP